MAAITQPRLVKFICGMISARAELFGLAQERLIELLGPVDIVSVSADIGEHEGFRASDILG